MKQMFKMLFAVCALSMLACTGCRAVDPVDVATGLSDEGSVIFSRSDDYTMLFGSRSANDYFETTYCHFSRNAAGQPVVEVGVRYRGGTSWTNWFRTMPKHVELSATCHFYRTPGAQAEGPAIYATNTQKLIFTLGQTTAFKAVCPVKTAMGFQVVLGQ